MKHMKTELDRLEKLLDTICCFESSLHDGFQILTEEVERNPYREYPDTHYTFVFSKKEVSEKDFYQVRLMFLKDSFLKKHIPDMFFKYNNLNEYLNSFKFLNKTWVDEINETHVDIDKFKKQYYKTKQSIKKQFYSVKKNIQKKIDELCGLDSLLDKNVPDDLRSHLVSILKIKDGTSNIICGSAIRTSLQFLIRRHGGVFDQDLKKEINRFYSENHFKFKKDNITVDEIQAVRKVGNFAVHPEDDVNITSEEIETVFNIYLTIVNSFFKPINIEKQNMKDEICKINNKFVRKK